MQCHRWQFKMLCHNISPNTSHLVPQEMDGTEASVSIPSFSAPRCELLPLVRSRECLPTVTCQRARDSWTEWLQEAVSCSMEGQISPPNSILGCMGMLHRSHAVSDRGRGQHHSSLAFRAGHGDETQQNLATLQLPCAPHTEQTLPV